MTRCSLQHFLSADDEQTKIDTFKESSAPLCKTVNAQSAATSVQFAVKDGKTDGEY